MIFLEKYKPGNRSINKNLLWEYDMDTFNFQKSKVIVAQRIIEMGTQEDFYAAFDIYGGIQEFRDIIKKIPYLNPIDMHFVCKFFNLKKNELKCFTKIQSNPEPWNS